MADGSKISWTNATWNPFRARNLETGGLGHFCVHESPGCKNCYAERMQVRFKNPVRYAAQDAAKVEIFMPDGRWYTPMSWKNPRMVFVCSMTDLFYEGHTFDQIDAVFSVMAACPQHTFQVLTKRARRMREYMVPRYSNTSRPVPGNVWLGVSVEDQARADERIPLLLTTPATIRWISAEPLLGPIDLTGPFPIGMGPGISALTGEPAPHSAPHGPPLDWVVIGGESGPGARPMHPTWARGLRDQCVRAGVKFHMKQWGEWVHAENWAHWMQATNRIVLNPDGSLAQPSENMLWYDDYDMAKMIMAGKKAAGRELDGKVWDEFPEARA